MNAPGGSVAAQPADPNFFTRKLPLIAWLRDHPIAIDVFIAAVLLAVGVPGLFARTGSDPASLRGGDALGVLLTVASTVPLVWRRRRPLTVLIVVIVPALALEGLHYRNAGGAAVAVAVYTVAALGSYRAVIAAGGLTLAGVGADLWFNRSDIAFIDGVAAVVTFATAFILGYSVKTRRRYLAELEAKAERLEAEKEMNARLAVEAERGRIARELHDVVAHNVSVMVISAGAARRVLETRPDEARELLATVESTGRDALTEMRRLLGVLRESTTGPDLSPQPSVDQLGALVASVREAGLPVVLEVEGEPRPLASGVDLSAYRIVQEALTNAIKHAGPAHATVRLRYGPDALHVEVEDDGRGAAAEPAPSPGHGLVGMRERVALFGGHLDAGPRRDGGYRVLATLPLDPAAA